MTTEKTVGRVKNINPFYLVYWVRQSVGSMGTARKLITEGKVKVNGEVVTDTFHVLDLTTKNDVSVVLSNPLKYITINYGISADTAKVLGGISADSEGA